MSVQSILGADGKIAAAFLPTGTANAYVDNPMTEDLDCNGFNINNLDDITVSSNLRSKSHDVLNNAGIVAASFTFGTNTTAPTGTGVLLKGPGPSLMNLLVDGEVSSTGVSTNSVDTDLVSLPAGSGSVGLEFVSPSNELYVKYTDGVGLSLTSDGGTANINTTGTVSAANITATGTIVPNQWNSYPQVADGAIINWAYPATSVNLYLVPFLEAGVYMVNVEAVFQRLGGADPTSLINLSYFANTETETVLTQSEESWLDNQQGITAFSWIVVHPGGGFVLQFAGGGLGAGDSYQIVSGGCGIIRLR